MSYIKEFQLSRNLTGEVPSTVIPRSYIDHLKEGTSYEFRYGKGRTYDRSNVWWWWYQWWSEWKYGMEERNDLPLPTPSLSLITTGKLCELANSSLNAMRLCDCDLSPPLRRDVSVCVCVCSSLTLQRYWRWVYAVTCNLELELSSVSILHFCARNPPHSLLLNGT